MVHLVEAYKGGMFGFYSAHASNTMSVAVFIGIIFRKKICWLFPIALIWSVWMSYTRVYLGVHYPGDILAGWMAGAALGLIFGNIAIFIISRITPGKNENPRLPQENDERIK
jgi:undecaprenyl-diphosphatase